MNEEQEKPMPEERIKDNELEVLPSNEEEEKEEILLTTTKSLKKSSKTSQQKVQEKTITFNKSIKSIEQTRNSSQ